MRQKLKTVAVIFVVVIVYAFILAYAYLNFSNGVPIGLPLSFTLFGIMIGLAGTLFYIEWERGGIS